MSRKSEGKDHKFKRKKGTNAAEGRKSTNDDDDVEILNPRNKVQYRFDRYTLKYVKASFIEGCQITIVLESLTHIYSIFGNCFFRY
jgi:hypothetical protein